MASAPALIRASLNAFSPRLQVRRGGRRVTLGRFATAEEAALCYARSPEGEAEALVEGLEAHFSAGKLLF